MPQDQISIVVMVAVVLLLFFVFDTKSESTFEFWSKKILAGVNLLLPILLTWQKQGAVGLAFLFVVSGFVIYQMRKK